MFVVWGMFLKFWLIFIVQITKKGYCCIICNYNINAKPQWNIFYNWLHIFAQSFYVLYFSVEFQNRIQNTLMLW